MTVGKYHECIETDTSRMKHYLKENDKANYFAMIMKNTFSSKT